MNSLLTEVLLAFCECLLLRSHGDCLCFISRQHEGDFSFKEAWFHLTDEYPIKYEAERLPPPLVADLNGDGKSEVLVATHDAKIQVLEPHDRRVDESFSETRLLAEVSLLPDKIRLSTGRRPVAMATGYVDRSYMHGEMRKQVLVVVTSGWSVMCFDHNLKKLWENNMQTMDFIEESLLSDNIDELHRRNANEKEDSPGNGTAADLRHFVFYAFAGRSGTIRWTRKTENVKVESSDASQLIPQHNYKLDAQALNSRHPGEDRREDTSLVLAHFRRHKRKLLKKTPGKPLTSFLHMPAENNPPGKDSSNKIARAIGKAASYAGSVKPKKLHLPEGGLHADINGDGVLDHVQVVGGNGAEQTVLRGSMEVLQPCWAVATSGVPVREQLFNASICHHGHFNLFQHGDFVRSFGRTVDSSALEVATPVLLRRHDGHEHHKGNPGDVIFLTNRGEVTSYSPGLHGEGAVWRWQLTTGATWSNLPSPSGLMEEAMVVPTLKTFSLRSHDSKEVIIAAGDQEAVVISPGGSLLTSIELPGSPTHALVLKDFSGDGFTDIILVTSGGVYGFVQTRQPGALFFSTLVGCLIIIMGVVFVSQHMNSTGKAKPRASSNHTLVMVISSHAMGDTDILALHAKIFWRGSVPERSEQGVEERRFNQRNSLKINAFDKTDITDIWNPEDDSMFEFPKKTTLNEGLLPKVYEKETSMKSD
ncbi:hypothetical protein AXF42_Ash020901 [Apostasia shenzhenica]|uniref:FG-GAP repeat-containing protein n=1 Tax=Apostasia shenzhenica TaxID=1088818 RepID=A0A2I0AD53_9ASPA|nr:hypothetical protein AXF42_Ash020901 [Apostasia shenzhenica]